MIDWLILTAFPALSVSSGYADSILNRGGKIPPPKGVSLVCHKTDGGAPV